MPQYKLIRIIENSQGEQTLEPGAIVQATPRVVYRLKDELGAQPQRLVLWRRGRDLVVVVDGQTVLTLTDFYAPGLDDSSAPRYLLDTGVPGDPWVSLSRAPQQRISESEDLVWKLDDAVRDAPVSTTQVRDLWAQLEIPEFAISERQHQADQQANREVHDLLDRWKPADAVLAAAAAPGRAAYDEIGDLVISGSVSAGPLYSGVTLYAYDSDGKLLGTASIDNNGRYEISAPQKGNYRGGVLIRVVDDNTFGADQQCGL